MVFWGVLYIVGAAILFIAFLLDTVLKNKK